MLFPSIESGGFSFFTSKKNAELVPSGALLRQ